MNLPAALQGARARWRRRQGRYDGATLAGFHAAWRGEGSAAALLRLAAFRRDLGRVLPRRWVAPLVAALPQLSAPERRVALGLLGEVTAADAIGASAAHWADAAPSMPLAAAQTGGDLAAVHARQAVWRREFADWLAARAAGGVCLVGNAAALRGAGLGPAIDAHAAVLRFNRYEGADTRAADTGRRLDVWVVSQSHAGTSPAALPWALMSGPDPRFRPQRWDALRPLAAAGTPLLTVPLAVWRELVAELQAPPSAGLLALAWLRALRGSWQGLSTAGIGVGLDRGGRHHLIEPRQRAAGRHDWAAERRLVARWQEQGLRALERT